MVKIGPNDYIPENNILQVTTYKSEGIRRKIKQYRDDNNFHLYDYSYSKSIKSIIITKNDEIILTAIAPDTLITRIEKEKDKTMKKKLEIYKEIEDVYEM